MIEEQEKNEDWDFQTEDELEDNQNEDTITSDLPPLAKQMLLAESKSKTACLLILDGSDAGNLIALDSRPLTLGRKPDCDVVLRDEGVSRYHAKIKLENNNRLSILDLKSTNGTYVRGEKIEQTVLEAGDKVLFGRRTLVRFILEDVLDRVYQQDTTQRKTRDNLTGIFSYQYMEERIASELSYAKRHLTPLTVVMFRVDRLPSITRELGPETRDQLFVLLSQAVADVIRTEDIFGRCRNDGFAIIANGVSAEGGTILGEKVRTQLANRPVNASSRNEEFQVTVSVGGVTVESATSVDHIKVLATAEHNLRQAQRKGLGQVVMSVF
jgi:diguanylate cyclase (GGDEF)-like protein